MPGAPTSHWRLPSAILTATFSEDTRAFSIIANTFERYTASTDKATLDPASSLQRGAAYDVRVTTGARDMAGNNLDQSSNTSGLQQKAWLLTMSN